MKTHHQKACEIAAALKSVEQAEKQLHAAKEEAARSVLKALHSKSESPCYLPPAIDMEDGRVLTIGDEWWEYKNVLDAVRLIPAPTKLSDLK